MTTPRVHKFLVEIFSTFFDGKGEVLASVFQDLILPYKEPMKKGTPKGQRIGFGLVKFLAAFLRALGCGPQATFNYLRLLKPSYLTLKKWPTEESFHRQVKDFQDEIKAQFVKRLEELFKTRDTILLEGNKPAVERIFGKAEYYGSELSQQISEAVIERLNEDKSLPLLHTAIQVLSIFYDSFESDPIQKQTEQDLEDFLSIHILCRILHTIRKTPAILHHSPEKAKWLSDMFARFISLWAIGTNLPMDLMDRLIDSDEWIADDLRFIEKLGLLKNKKGAPKD
jgi:hypothetical protein